jgi:hypothetical protein
VGHRTGLNAVEKSVFSVPDGNQKPIPGCPVRSLITESNTATRSPAIVVEISVVLHGTHK